MKKLFLTTLFCLFISTFFGQNFIGEKKKYVINQLKESAVSISKPQKLDTKNNLYSIDVTFKNGGVASYSFTSDDYCYSYVLLQQWDSDLYNYLVKDYDNKFLRAFSPEKVDEFDKKQDIWKESKGGTFVYRWIVKNYNKNSLYILFITKENYENFKYQYYRELLGS